MTTWSIESELIEIAGVSDLQGALARLGLLSSSEETVTLESDRTWQRGGAETYILYASVRTAHRTTTLVFKACVALGDVTGVAKVLDQWLHRRSLLAESGASTPYLFGRSGGTLVEEFVPLPLAEAFLSATPAQRSRLCLEVGRLAAILGHLGFPVMSVHDLRSRGDDVVIVDFGEDLGPPGIMTPDSTNALEEMLRTLAEPLMLTPADLTQVALGYSVLDRS